MPGRGDDHVIAIGLAVRDRRSVDCACGDHRGQIISRIGAPIRRDCCKISLEIRNNELQHLDRLFGTDNFRPRPVDLRIGRAEQLLGQHEHPGLILRGDPEYVHHDVERIIGRNILGEIAFAAHCQHFFDRVAGDLADACFDCAQVLRHEPALRQQPVFHVIGRIHLDKRADQMAIMVRRDGLDAASLQRRGRPGWGANGIGEERIVLADLKNVSVLRDGPERDQTAHFQQLRAACLRGPRRISRAGRSIRHRPSGRQGQQQRHLAVLALSSSLEQSAQQAAEQLAAKLPRDLSTDRRRRRTGSRFDHLFGETGLSASSRALATAARSASRA